MQQGRGGHNPLRVGVIPVGAISYIQDGAWWRDRYRGAPVCRNPWIIESFLNGTMAAARRYHETGQWEDLTMAGPSDMAVLRPLRDGRRRLIAVRVLLLHEDEGLRRDPATYPDLPGLRREQRAAVQPRPRRASSAVIRMSISASPSRETQFSPRRA